MNEKMQKLMIYEQANNFDFNSNIKDLFLPSFMKVHDCIIISDDIIKLSIEDFEKLISGKGDRSGYEYSCNEILVNQYVNSFSDTKDLIYIGLVIIDIWSWQLKFLEPESVFCFILSVDEHTDFVTLFFHKYRRDEGLWISTNLEPFEQPVGYKLI